MTSENPPNDELSPRELAVAEAVAVRVAKETASAVIEELTDSFYKQVGKTFVSRIFIWVGAGLISLGVAKGWITLTPPKV
jgi:hypothetical protein